jgi:hypothetical protein
MAAFRATQEDDVRFGSDAVVVMETDQVPNDHPHGEVL